MSRRAAAGAGLAALIAALAVAGCGGGTAAFAPPGAAEPPPAPAPAAAAGAGAQVRSEPFSIVPDAPGRRVEVTAAPGATAPIRVRVANGADVPRSFALRGEGGWIEVPQSVTVPPRQSRAVAGRVRVPAEARPGRHRGAVVARAGGDPGAALSVSYESSAIVLVAVAGPGAR